MNKKVPKIINTNLSKNLDGIRGIAAIIVFLAHFNQIFNLPIYGLKGWIFYIPMIMASYAVMIFFVLSGFVITYSIISKSKLDNLFDWNKYILNRFIRIYPPYIFAIIATVVIYLIIVYFNLRGAESFRVGGELYIFREKADLDIVNLFQNVFMMQGNIKNIDSISLNGPLWTISYEWLLYMLAMFLAIALYNKHLTIPIILIAGIFYFEIHSDNTRMLFLCAIWTLGAISAILYYKMHISKLLIYILILFLSLGCFFWANLDWKILLPYAGNMNYMFQFFSTLMLLLVFCLLSQSCIFHGFRFFGKFSYSLYVLHFPLLIIFFSLLHRPYVSNHFYYRVGIFIAITLLIFSLSATVAKYLENVGAIKYFLSSKISLLKKSERLKC